MTYFDDFMKSHSTKATDNRSNPETKLSLYAGDTRKAQVLQNEKLLLETLFDGIEVPEAVKEMLSVNISTSMVSKERAIPTEVQKVRALWDYWTFLDIINFHGGSLAFADCHRELIAFKFRPDAQFKQLVLEARGMLKSTLLCVGYALWRVYQNPNVRLFVGTESLKLSKAFIREIEDYLTDDHNVNHVWNARPHYDGPLIPAMDSMGKQRRLIRDVADEFGDKLPGGSDKKKVWRAEAIQVLRSRAMKEPTITAGSVGQASTGFHFDEIIFDDIHTYDNTSTEAKIDKCFSFIYDIESVLDPPYVDIELCTRLHSVLGTDFNKARRWCISGGRQTVIGTRYDDLDYYGHIIEHQEALGYEVHIKNIYANGIDDSDGYRWPEKWSRAVEENIRAQFEKRYGATGLQRFYSQYHNKIVRTEDAILNWQCIHYVHPNNYRVAEDGWVEVLSDDHKIVAHFKPNLVIDPTSTGSAKSDFCAICVGGMYEQHLYICDFWMRRETPQVWLEKMYELIDKWDLYQVTIEMVGGFKILEFTIQQMWVNNPNKYRMLSIKSYNPPSGAGASSKQQRLEMILSPLLHNENLHMPLHTSRDIELKKQFMFFGRGTAKDDGPDVLAILWETASRMPREFATTQVDNEITVEPSFGGVAYHSTSTYGGVAYAA